MEIRLFCRQDLLRDITSHKQATPCQHANNAALMQARPAAGYYHPWGPQVGPEAQRISQGLGSLSQGGRL
jgi:hypothetical protein